MPLTESELHRAALRCAQEASERGAPAPAPDDPVVRAEALAAKAATPLGRQHLTDDELRDAWRHRIAMLDAARSPQGLRHRVDDSDAAWVRDVLRDLADRGVYPAARPATAPLPGRFETSRDPLRGLVEDPVRDRWLERLQQLGEIYWTLVVPPDVRAWAWNEATICLQVLIPALLPEDLLLMRGRWTESQIEVLGADAGWW